MTENTVTENTVTEARMTEGTTQWHRARGVASASTPPLPAETVPLDLAIGRILASDIVAPTAVPHYASSAMDGWAVCGSGPWTVVAAPNLSPGQAAAIVTGGLIPEGAEAVLRSESGAVDDGRNANRSGSGVGERLSVLAAAQAAGEPRTGQHLRPAGGEAQRGEVVVVAGTPLNPAHIAIAASCGRDDLSVIGRPNVLLLLSGDEVIERGIPGPGRVRDSFGPALPAVLRMLGAGDVSTRRVRDDFTATVDALLESPATAEVVITTGGTGGSAVDHLRAALESIGAEFLVPRMAMRPGGPTMLARLTDGRLLVGLPGNPLAAMMGVLTLAAPVLAAFGGGPAPACGRAVSASTIEGRGDSSVLVPFVLVNGRATASPWLGSGMMRGIADAAGVLVVPPEGLRQGEFAETLALPWA